MNPKETINFFISVVKYIKQYTVLFNNEGIVKSYLSCALD